MTYSMIDMLKSKVKELQHENARLNKKLDLIIDSHQQTNEKWGEIIIELVEQNAKLREERDYYKKIAKIRDEWNTVLAKKDARQSKVVEAAKKLRHYLNKNYHVENFGDLLVVMEFDKALEELERGEG